MELEELIANEINFLESQQAEAQKTVDHATGAIASLKWVLKNIQYPHDNVGNENH